MNSTANWRTPVLVLVCGAIILTLGLGIRASFGLFLQPMSMDLGWGRSHFSFAMALSNLIWGLAQPFFGAWADKQGARRVVAVSGLLYAGGLALMPFSTTPLMLDASAGLMVGLGLSGVSFGVILGVVGRAFPPERRSLALGIASSGGSFGQFLMLPFGQLLISTLGWQTALLVLAGTIMATVPLAAAMMEGRRPVATGAQQSLNQALREAGGHSGFWYLTAGFCVCGFQVAVISVHLPAYLVDVKMTPAVGATALALIGLFNIAGSFVAGYLGGRFSKKYLLSGIYILRAVMEKTELVSAYFNRGESFILTSIIDIDPDEELVFLDLGANEALPPRLVRSTYAFLHFPAVR
jgi:MFS family permease